MREWSGPLVDLACIPMGLGLLTRTACAGCRTAEYNDEQQRDAGCHAGPSVWTAVSLKFGASSLPANAAH